ncbi:hypothetical protein OM427_07205 [Halomonas sp. 18H]|uniref:hypothetical protein n=1 Tax=Halomonas almeriensis TaxID=308163 RepID=UPI0022319407|nr:MULTISPECIES: hypothetical protein [Halomonas]MCW4149318.1 hypothetical protein [Halomonas sp. 18H]MDN3553736.1 hypothetical protein [Halomonas almeriensis]
MKAERSQLFYQCTFLYVSFQAIHQSIGGADDDTQPCWLDTSLLSMLNAELQRIRRHAAHVPTIIEPLDIAVYHCNMLLANCPGAMNSQFCRDHLDAIMQALKATTEALSAPAAMAAPSGWSSIARWLTPWRQR